MLLLRRQCALLDDGNGEAADADALACIFLDYISLPDLCPLSDVERRTGANDVAFRNGADVVGVDLQPDGAEFIGVDGHPRSDAAQAFREDATCPAMQNAEGLRSAGVDGQTAFQEIGAKLGEFKSQMRGHVRVTNGFEGVKRVVFEPDHFYFFPVF